MKTKGNTLQIQVEIYLIDLIEKLVSPIIRVRFHIKSNVGHFHTLKLTSYMFYKITFKREFFFYLAYFNK